MLGEPLIRTLCLRLLANITTEKTCASLFCPPASCLLLSLTENPLSVQPLAGLFHVMCPVSSLLHILGT